VEVIHEDLLVVTESVDIEVDGRLNQFLVDDSVGSIVLSLLAFVIDVLLSDIKLQTEHRLTLLFLQDVQALALHH